MVDSAVITLEPIGGLGNRLRATASARALADVISQPLRVIWTRTDACGCPFSQLFEPLPETKVIERSWWANRVLRRVELWSGRHACVIRQPDMRRLREAGYDFRQLASTRSIFIQTFERFQVPRSPGLKAFLPVPSLQADIDTVAARFSGAMVGVHIRRGDHDLSRLHSPTALFVARMAREIAHTPATKFFLATDAPDVELELTHRFGDRVLTFPKPFSRTTVSGIRGAVVELFLLARTARILGSFYSSFSEAAAQLGGCPLEVVVDAEAGLTPSPVPQAL